MEEPQLPNLFPKRKSQTKSEQGNYRWHLTGLALDKHSYQHTHIIIFAHQSAINAYIHLTKSNQINVLGKNHNCLKLISNSM